MAALETNIESNKASLWGVSWVHQCWREPAEGIFLPLLGKDFSVGVGPPRAQQSMGKDPEGQGKCVTCILLLLLTRHGDSILLPDKEGSSPLMTNYKLSWERKGSGRLKWIVLTTRSSPGVASKTVVWNLCVIFFFFFKAKLLNSGTMISYQMLWFWEVSLSVSRRV